MDPMPGNMGRAGQDSRARDTKSDLDRAVEFLNAVLLENGIYAHWAAETCSWWVVSQRDLEMLGRMICYGEENAADRYSLWCTVCTGDEVKLPRSTSPSALLAAWRETYPQDQSR